MRTETRVVYITKDGKSFLSEEECVEHEKGLIENLLSDVVRCRLFDYYDIECPDEVHISKFIIDNYKEIKSLIEGE